MSSNRMFDDYRKTVILAWACWGASVILVFGRALELVPQRAGTIALLTIGIGIATSVSLGRMRLGSAITQVFQIGLRSAITLSANVFTDTCIMVVGRDGCVEKADHADAIGWEAEELHGRELRTLISPRSHGIREIIPGTSITSPMLNQKGERFDARLSFASLDSSDNGSKADDGRLIVTVSPVVNSEGSYEIA